MQVEPVELEECLHALPRCVCRRQVDDGLQAPPTLHTQMKWYALTQFEALTCSYEVAHATWKEEANFCIKARHSAGRMWNIAALEGRPFSTGGCFAATAGRLARPSELPNFQGPTTDCTAC